MQLTRFTDIGLRVLMRLVTDDEAVTHTTRALADELAVPYAHVAKVVSRLSEIGVVHSRRGRTGGLTITELGRSAGVGWVTRQLEGDAPVVDCDGPTPCPLRGACSLRGALARARDAFYASLDELTIAELTPATGPTLIALTTRATVARGAIADGDRTAPDSRRSRS